MYRRFAVRLEQRKWRRLLPPRWAGHDDLARGGVLREQGRHVHRRRELRHGQRVCLDRRPRLGVQGVSSELRNGRVRMRFWSDLRVLSWRRSVPREQDCLRTWNGERDRRRGMRRYWRLFGGLSLRARGGRGPGRTVPATRLHGRHRLDLRGRRRWTLRDDGIDHRRRWNRRALRRCMHGARRLPTGGGLSLILCRWPICG